MAFTLISVPVSWQGISSNEELNRVVSHGKQANEGHPLPAAFEAEYAMLLPYGATPATDVVMRKTPPSALSLRM